jgi:nucleotide-binding universal stress UspA family protein
MLTLKRILCPVDLSEVSAHGAEWAGTIAGWYGATITAVHAVDPAVPAFQESGDAARHRKGDLEDDVRRRLETEARAMFDAAVKAGTAVHTVIDVASPSAAILRHAQSLPADLIVMGTHGASGFERLVLGSVTEKVLRTARCPVLTVPPRAEATSQLPFSRVLCAVDFSDPSLRGVDYAMSLAKESDARLTLVHIVEWPWPEPPPPPMDEVPPVLAMQLGEFRKHREEEAAARLLALIPEEARVWCRPTIEVRHGKAYVEVLRIAADVQADLIVIGMHGRHPIDLAMFGSTVNQVVRRARCPVLTIRT